MSTGYDLIGSVMGALSHPFYVIDAESYVIKLANPAAYAGELPEGITCYVLTHRQSEPCDAFGERCPLAEVKQSKQPVFVEHLHYDAAGHRKAFEVRAFPILGGDGRVTDIIEYTVDISARKEAERLKDEFISMVSHELRTPLHHIKGFVTTLLQTDVTWDAATQQDFLQSINRETDRLSDLVEKILDLSRLEAGTVPLEREWYQVADLVDGALQRRHSVLAGRPVHVDLQDDLPALLVDGQEVELVLTNLIENALKYSPEGTPIEIGAERRTNEVILSVADHGMGIPAQHQQRIFDRFFRVPHVGPRPPGTGLGLAICQRIVEAHGGRIWVASQPGEGSSFFFSLPVAALAGCSERG